MRKSRTASVYCCKPVYCQYTDVAKSLTISGFVMVIHIAFWSDQMDPPPNSFQVVSLA